MMRLRHLRLENIRSYRKGLIEIPEGAVLFTGDIGSGKTTVLLALEFALFGTRRGGPSLLRHDSDSGSVQLDFLVDDTTVSVKRSLKRGKKGVSADECWVGIDSELEKTSTTELKQKVLKVLGYPQELISKSNPLIYRYTVYTPQEEMKQIVLSTTEQRLETIRKIFNVDKYKLIKDNGKLFVSYLKNKRKEYEGRIYDLDTKKNELIEKKNESLEIEKEKKEIEPKLELLKEELKKVETERKNSEEEVEKLKESKNKLDLLELKQNNLMDSLEKSKEEIESLKKEIWGTEISEEGLINVGDELKVLNFKFDEVTEQISEKEKQHYGLQQEISSLTDRLTKISQIEDCPTCNQKVGEDHKKHIQEETKTSITPKRETLVKLEEEIKTLKEEKLRLDGEKTRLDQLKHEQQLILMKKERVLRDQKRVRELETGLIESKKQFGELSVEKQTLLEVLKSWEVVNSLFNERKKIEEEVRSNEREIAIKFAQIEENIKSNKEMQTRLEKEIIMKERDKMRAVKLGEIQHFIDEEFFSLVDDIEKNVMIKIHRDFNEAFVKWFSILIGSEDLIVRTDFSFNPLIEQNGHETNFESLSGGERTACALAYRLALNQAVNKMAETLKTKNLIILDEPTDGFSTEQLERLQLVLDELDNEQVIIVSHEPRIEQYVNSVLRFEKIGGETVVT